MDRSDRYGAFEHDMGQRQSDWYRQSYGAGEQQGMAMQWGYIAAGALMVGLGGWMLYRGARDMADSGGDMGMSRRRLGRAADNMLQGSSDSPGIQVREQVTVNRPVADLYRFWRDVENLPRVMGYLESVTKSGDRRSHWVAKGPAGQKIEWDAEVTDARENEVVAWRSLEGSEVPNEGSVRFSRSSDGSGTIIDVALTYHPPAGKAGAMVAKLLGREPSQEIRRDLQRFKQRVESGNLILGTGSTDSYRNF